jgi:hypothetical protein
MVVGVGLDYQRAFFLADRPRYCGGLHGAWLIASVDSRAVFLTWLMGFLWGIGGLTFGLSMRYRGMSLGYALALGSCAAFGTLIPPLFSGLFGHPAAPTKPENARKRSACGFVTRCGRKTYFLARGSWVR